MRYLANGRWQLADSWDYVGNNQTITVEKGFVTDLASIPWFCRWLIQTYGIHLPAALLHDWLCELARQGEFSRSDADGLFRRLLRESGVRWLQRWMMWAAVRIASHPRTWMAHGTVELVRMLLLAIVGVAFLAVPTLVILLFAGIGKGLNRLTPRV